MAYLHPPGFVLDVELHSYPCQHLGLHLLASPAGFALLGVAVVFDMYISVSVVSSWPVAIFSITECLSVPRGLGVSLSSGLFPLLFCSPWSGASVPPGPVAPPVGAPLCSVCSGVLSSESRWQVFSYHRRVKPVICVDTADVRVQTLSQTLRIMMMIFVHSCCVLV